MKIGPIRPIGPILHKPVWMNLESLRKLCLTFPGAAEDVKWGNDLTFVVGEKMFCITGFKNPPSICIKVRAEDFDELVATPGIKPAPYLARNKWVVIEDVNDFSSREIEAHLRTSYELVKAKLPKRVQAGFISTR